MKTLNSILGALTQRFLAWRERERAFAELSALDDHTLADLGLRRADIPMVVYSKREEIYRSDDAASNATPANNNDGLRAA
jgi:uncharacterized protein YjiS (DUF1127 family)